METTSNKKLILVLDYPRTCSNLLGKFFSAHPRIEYIHWPYLIAATAGPDCSTAKISDETQKAMMAKFSDVSPADMEHWGKTTFEMVNVDLREKLGQAQNENKIPFIQEHAAFCIKDKIALNALRNPPPSDLQIDELNLPGAILQHSIPLLLIRHPALTIPSFYRKQLHENMLRLEDESFHWWTSLDWSRMLYELFEKSHDLPNPIVVDAEDVVYNTKALTTHLCTIFDISPEGVRHTWEPGLDGPLQDGTIPSFLATLRDSTGVVRSERKVSDKDIDLDLKYSEWIAEFGEKDAASLRLKVETELPSYWYLSKRALQ